jgi:hypothetical protein
MEAGASPEILISKDKQLDSAAQSPTVASQPQVMMPEDKKRDLWDKAQILLDPLGKILTALLVVYLGYLANRALDRDQKRRAYVELLSRREEADESLRKDMFGKIIDQFIAPNKSDLDNRILNLELLTYNFHESIDLGPLLKQVYAQSWSDRRATSSERKRLQNMAQDVVGQEMVALVEAGCKAEAQVQFDKLEKNYVEPEFLTCTCPAKNGLPAKSFSADVIANPEIPDLRRDTEVDIVLTAHSIPAGKRAADSEDRFEFTVNPFDFPLMNNFRLRNGGGRVSMAMTRLDDGGVTLALVYFPDSRTSLRDKPFYDEVLKALDKEQVNP